MAKQLSALILLSVFLAACGGVAAHGPVSADQKMSSKASSGKRPDTGKDQK